MSQCGCVCMLCLRCVDRWHAVRDLSNVLCERESAEEGRVRIDAAAARCCASCTSCWRWRWWRGTASRSRTSTADGRSTGWTLALSLRRTPMSSMVRRNTHTRWLVALFGGLDGGAFYSQEAHTPFFFLSVFVCVATIRSRSITNTASSHPWISKCPEDCHAPATLAVAPPNCLRKLVHLTTNTSLDVQLFSCSRAWGGIVRASAPRPPASACVRPCARVRILMSRLIAHAHVNASHETHSDERFRILFVTEMLNARALVQCDGARSQEANAMNAMQAGIRKAWLVYSRSCASMSSGSATGSACCLSTVSSASACRSRISSELTP